eukprot:5142098-Ditylum_brightwellii.AAC.1
MDAVEMVEAMVEGQPLRSMHQMVKIRELTMMQHQALPKTKIRQQMHKEAVVTHVLDIVHTVFD